MSKEIAEKAQKEAKDKQNRLSAQWKGIKETFPEAYNDYLAFIDNFDDMYVDYGKERSMPGPDGKRYTIDDHTIAALLQGSRVCDIVSAYIKNRVDSGVEPKN